MIFGLLVFACWFAFANDVSAAEADTRTFEMRVYYANEGKLDDLLARFRNHTMRLFEKHGMTNLGYFTPVENPERKLIYFLAFPSLEAKSQAWKDFGGDPDWKAVVKESEANGKLVAKVESTLLSATDFSPLVKAEAKDAQRVFELRTYTATPGKLDNLLARFREQTCELFSKHGMTNVAYWTVRPNQKVSQETLVYLLAHESVDKAEAAFKAFRNDPKWKAAKAASEEAAGGSLTVTDGVKSVYLLPTDFSPVK
jgi:uncharacterized protein (DUF1330 family)